MTIAPVSIFHIIPSLQQGGAEKTLVDLLSDPAARHGVSVVVFFGGGALEPRLADLGVRLIDLKGSGFFSLFGAIWRLSRLLRTERPRIVQSWLYYADFLCLTALFLSGRRRKTGLFWGVRCSDHRGEDYHFPLRAAIWACTRLSHLPDVVVYNSHAGKLSHAALGYRPRRAIVIENGIDSARFQLGRDVRTRMRKELGWGDSDVAVAMIGRNDPMKGYRIFFNLIARFPGVRAAAIGRGTETLPRQPNIALLGIRNDIPEILAAADILVSCSQYGEGFPNVVAEAMAAGLPVICTDVGDAARIVGEDGFIVAPDDFEALAKALETLIASPDLRRSLGIQGRRRVVSHFSIPRMAASFNELYHGHDPERRPKPD